MSLKWIRPSFLILSTLVPYLCSMTTMSFSANDTVRIPIQSTKWSNRSVGHKIQTPMVYNSSVYSMAKPQPLIKLRRLSSGFRNSQRKIENPNLTQDLQPPNFKAPVSELEGQSTTSTFYQFRPHGSQNTHSHETLSKSPHYNTNNQISNLYPDMKPPLPDYQHEFLPQYAPPMYHPEYEHEEAEEHEEEPPEIEDKVFSKSIVATKALTIGKIIFSFFLVLVVVILGVLSQFGTNLTPIALPFALLPVGLIALALFIPLFFVFIPLVVGGFVGGKKRRRRRFIDEDREHILQSLEKRIRGIFDQLVLFLSLEPSEPN